jgi:hypothetical protein
MYLDIALIDFLEKWGALTSYSVRPKNGQVIIDLHINVDPSILSTNHDVLDIGGIRIYNSAQCSIHKRQARIRAWAINIHENAAAFGFEHLYLRVGSKGIYNLVLPKNWRLKELFIFRPSSTTNLEKTIFEMTQYVQSFDEDAQTFYDFLNNVSKESWGAENYDVYWDRCNSSQMIEIKMDGSLQTKTDEFSFLVAGLLTQFNLSDHMDEYVPAREVEKILTPLVEAERLMSGHERD